MDFDSPDTHLRIYLEKVAAGKITSIDEHLVEEFGEHCKNTLRKLHEPREKFRLRLSNIGRKARQLWLEKNFGRQPAQPEFMLKMTYAHIAEHIVLTLLKASNAKVESNNEKVGLQLNTTVIAGEYDTKINGKHWDFKTASPYSYDNKFTSADGVLGEDSFGYGAQAVGYSIADGTPFGGWFAINLVTGGFKAVPAEKLNEPEVQKQYLEQMETTIKVVNDELPVPECDGVVEETFRRKLTGNKVLNRECTYCDHKQRCHPGIQYLPSACSQAKDKPYVWYVELKNKDVEDGANDE